MTSLFGASRNNILRGYVLGTLYLESIYKAFLTQSERFMKYSLCLLIIYIKVHIYHLKLAMTTVIKWYDAVIYIIITLQYISVLYF